MELFTWVTCSGKRWYKLCYALMHNRPFNVEKVNNYCNLKQKKIVLYCIFDFYFLRFHKQKCWFWWIKWKNPSFCQLFSIIFQWSKTFQRLFSLLCKSIIIEIINIQMRLYLHNCKGYRALLYAQLKLMLCAFQPYITLNFRFLWRISPFLRAGHIFSLLNIICGGGGGGWVTVGAGWPPFENQPCQKIQNYHLLWYFSATLDPPLITKKD